MEYKVETFKNDKLEMDYLKFGSGPKNMIIIPGVSLRPLCCSPNGVVNAYSVFGEDYTVYLFDRKKNKTEPYYVEDMANDTLEVIKGLGIKGLYAYGASQGGQIIMAMAIKYPKLFNKIVLASTSYYMNGMCYDFFDQLYKYADETNARSLASYMTRKVYSKAFCEKYLNFFVDMYKDLSKEELEQFKCIVNKDDRLYLYNDLDKITAKVMIIASELDDVYGYEPSLQMTLKLNCDCVIYDEYGHGVYDEASDFIERMKNFFDK